MDLAATHGPGWRMLSSNWVRGLWSLSFLSAGVCFWFFNSFNDTIVYDSFIQFLDVAGKCYFRSHEHFSFVPFPLQSRHMSPFVIVVGMSYIGVSCLVLFCIFLALFNVLQSLLRLVCFLGPWFCFVLVVWLLVLFPWRWLGLAWVVYRFLYLFILQFVVCALPIVHILAFQVVLGICFWGILLYDFWVPLGFRIAHSGLCWAVFYFISRIHGTLLYLCCLVFSLFA